MSPFLSRIVLAMMAIASIMTNTSYGCPPSFGQPVHNYQPAAVPMHNYKPAAVPMPAPAMEPQPFMVQPEIPRRFAPQEQEQQGPFIVCTRNSDGEWSITNVVANLGLAKEIEGLLRQMGEQVWTMKLRPIPKGISISMSDGQMAVAIAVSLGGEVRAHAVGANKRVEAIASR